MATPALLRSGPILKPRLLVSGPGYEGGFVVAGLPSLLERFSATTDAAAHAPHFFALEEGQPSGWPSRGSRTVGRGGHPKGRSGA